jgi:hypothetical protein
MRGTARKISIPRCFIADLMRASLDIPFVSLARLLNIQDLVEARAETVRPPGWAAIFVKAFALVAKDEPALRTLYVKWPWPGFYELPRSVATVAIARIVDGEDCVLPQKIGSPEASPLAEIDALIHHAKQAPVEEVAAFRKVLQATRLPLPLRRLVWWIGLNSGRQRANYFGSFSLTSVAAVGPGELHALTPGPFIISYGMETGGTISVVLRWDHRITDAALVGRALCRLEQVLNTEIAAELRAARPQIERAVRAVAT